MTIEYDTVVLLLKHTCQQFRRFSSIQFSTFIHKKRIEKHTNAGGNKERNILFSDIIGIFE